MSTIAILGEDTGHRSHQELNALLPRLRDELGLHAEWVSTTSGFDVTTYDGVWLVPGGPYPDDDAVLEALRVVQEKEIPFLGTCSGMQYAVIELTRNLLGAAATHEEAAGASADNAVAALACSLYGEERLVNPLAGSRFATWVEEPFVGMHFCNYAPTPAAVARLVEAGVVVGATAPDAGAEVLELPDHPFYLASMFQPHIGALAGTPIHPLISAFADAVTARH